jgi:hypothetical protein
MIFKPLVLEKPGQTKPESHNFLIINYFDLKFLP